MKINQLYKLSIISFLLLQIAFSQVRIKDIVTFENANQESVVGYGLVTGLDGTGDRASRSFGAVFTVQSISNMLERFGITVDKAHLRTRNVAAVMVTAMKPAFGRIGSKFDVLVSSLGDATSLEGGVLLMTPLVGNDGVYYGNAQGPISIGGYNIETTAGEKVKKNHALVGRVPNGGSLMKISETEKFDPSQPIRLLLNNADFVTVSRISESINNVSVSGIPLAKPVNAGVVEINMPANIQTQEDAIFFIASIETLQVVPDIEARVVINERTGTVVAGGNVKINEVMISHGSLTIQIKRTPIISQPSAPFTSTGQTIVEYVTQTQVQEQEAKAAVIKPTTSVRDLAAAMNELSLKPRDIIAIFQSIKEAGALNAKLVII